MPEIYTHLDNENKPKICQEAIKIQKFWMTFPTNDQVEELLRFLVNSTKPYHWYCVITLNNRASDSPILITFFMKSV